MLIGHGSREQILQAYRDVRDQLFRRIKQRFGLEGGPTVANHRDHGREFVERRIGPGLISAARGHARSQFTHSDCADAWRHDR